MRTLILALAIVAVPAQAAELVARQGADEARIFDAPCPHTAALAHLPEQDRSSYRQAIARFQGAVYPACWRRRGGLVHMVYEDGDQGLIPVDQFTEQLGV